MIVTITNLFPEDRNIPLPNYRSVNIGALRTITLEDEYDKPFFLRMNNPSNGLSVRVNEGKVISPIAQDLPKEMQMMQDEAEVKDVEKEPTEDEPWQAADLDDRSFDERVADGTFIPKDNDKSDEVSKKVDYYLEPKEVTKSCKRKGDQRFAIPSYDMDAGKFTITDAEGLSIDGEGKASWTKDTPAGEYLIEVPVGDTDKGTADIYRAVLVLTK